MWNDLGIYIRLSGGEVHTDTLVGKFNTGDSVHFADIDGDGKDDLLVVEATTGSVTAYLSNGKGFSSNGFAIAPGVRGANSVNVRFMDVSGDGRFDYVLISTDGSLEAWLNTGIFPNIKWKHIGQVASGVSGSSDVNVQFADLNNDGRSDYIMVNKDNSVSWWANAGDSTTADGLILADIDGDGLDDFLFIGMDGSVSAWRNRGGLGWDELGVIAPGPPGAARKNVRMADINGDGRVSTNLHSTYLLDSGPLLL